MGITDGTYSCARCGEWMTSCFLCDDQLPSLVNNKVRLEIERKSKEKAELELWMQEKAIRRAADARYKNNFDY